MEGGQFHSIFLCKQLLYLMHIRWTESEEKQEEEEEEETAVEDELKE